MKTAPVRSLRVASARLASYRGDAPRNVRNAVRSLARAAREAIDLVVFPEACIAGYADMKSLRREEIEALAEASDGPSVSAIAAAVERHGVAAGVGLIERAPDGRVFDSYVLCMPDGRRHCHRKLHAFEHRRIARGDRFTVFDTSWGIRVGILIGGDNYLVENVRMTAVMGARLLVAPHRSYRTDPGGDVAQPVSMAQWLGRRAAGRVGRPVCADRGEHWFRNGLAARAADNGMCIVFSDGTDSRVEPGAGMIVDASGRVLAEQGAGSDAFALADLDLDEIADGDGGPWLSGRRPDLYRALSASAGEDAMATGHLGAGMKGSIAIGVAQIRRTRSGL